jgi:hypothetical protein
MRHQVPRPYKPTDKSIVLCILIYEFLHHTTYVARDFKSFVFSRVSRDVNQLLGANTIAAFFKLYSAECSGPVWCDWGFLEKTAIIIKCVRSRSETTWLFIRMQLDLYSTSCAVPVSPGRTNRVLICSWPLGLTLHRQEWSRPKGDAYASVVDYTWQFLL